MPRAVGPVGRWPEGASPYGVEDLIGMTGDWLYEVEYGSPFDPEDRGGSVGGGEYALAMGLRSIQAVDQDRRHERVGVRLCMDLPRT
jgi:hypothetical protein